MVFMMVSQSAFAMEKDQHHQKKKKDQDNECEQAIESENRLVSLQVRKAMQDYLYAEEKNDQVLKDSNMQYINALTSLNLTHDENQNECNHYKGQFENCKENIKCRAVIVIEIMLTLKEPENDDYINFFKTLKRPTDSELECKDDKFEEIRQEGLDDFNSRKINEIIDKLDLVEQTEKKVEKVLSAKNNIKYLKQIIQISIDSPSLETEETNIVGVAIRVSKRLNKPVTPKSTVVNSKDETNNVDVNSKNETNNVDVTDRKCCKYFTIVSCIIIIVIVVVILFSENDEEEEAKEEDEENPNTPADIEEVSFQDLENSESIKHAIDNMNVVHKGNKVDQIASSREKIDGDGLVDVNATVEEVYVSE